MLLSQGLSYSQLAGACPEARADIKPVEFAPEFSALLVNKRKQA